MILQAWDKSILKAASLQMDYQKTDQQYVVCVNYSWHQGKFYPGMVCGKTRDFGVRKDWAQILVL